MKVARGDIVLLDFPFASGGKSKVRPALVVQQDRLNRLLQNTIVALFSSRTDRAQRLPTQFLIRLNSPAGKASGLLMDSAVNCTVLLTVDQEKVLRKLGSLPAVALRQVNGCLRSSLGL
jgi:mRNA-degrading endonuclease toxin of MazEF toxin-antitoxin module